MGPINFTAFFQVIGIWALISAPFVLLRNKWSLIRDKFNLGIILAHIFDASSTYIAVDFYGYGEQHATSPLSAPTNKLLSLSSMVGDDSTDLPIS